MNIVNKNIFQEFLNTLTNKYPTDIANVQSKLNKHQIKLVKESLAFKNQLIEKFKLDYRIVILLNKQEQDGIEITQAEKEELDKLCTIYTTSITDNQKKRIYTILQELFEKNHITLEKFLSLYPYDIELISRIELDIILLDENSSDYILNDLHEKQLEETNLDSNEVGVVKNVIELDDFLLSKLKIPVADVPNAVHNSFKQDIEKENTLIWDKSLNRNITTLSELLELQAQIPKQEEPVYDTLDAMLMAMKEDLDISKLNMKKIKNHFMYAIENEIAYSTLFIENIPKNILNRIQHWLDKNHMLVKKYKVYCRTDYCYGYATKGYTKDKQLQLNYLLNYCNQFDDFESIVWENNQVKKEDVLKIYYDLFGQGCLDCEKRIELKELINLYKKYNGDLFTIAYYEYVQVTISE